MSKVELVNFTDRSPLKLLREILRKKNYLNDIGKGDFVGIKLHVGEWGNITHLRPQIVEVIADELKERGARTFIFDCNTLYRVKRWNAVDHHKTALRNGFSFSTVGVPFIIGDGLIGRDEIVINTDFDEVKEVYAGSIIKDMDYMLVLSHFKFHDLFGYGGAIKNVGMGIASRRGKLFLHSDVKPEVIGDRCILCGDCAINCPENAIKIKEKAVIDRGKCIGCGMCVVSCKEGAIKFSWSQNRNTAEKTVYYTKAILDKIENYACINVLMDITPHCDCFPTTKNLTVQNIGFLLSNDIVSIDNASLDLVESMEPLSGVDWKDIEVARKNKVKALFENPADVKSYFKLGEEIGLGSLDYNLEEFNQK